MPDYSAHLSGLKIALLCFLIVWFGALVFWWNNPHSVLEEHKIANLPFGFLTSPEGGIELQDFSYNLVFFRGIRDRLVDHPYRLEDQEKLVRQLVPGLSSGLSHGYSPVGFVLALPLLQVSGATANFLYDFFCALGILLLFQFYLLPRTHSPLQLCALALCAASVCMALTVALGQSALLTTTLLGLLWAWLQNGRRSLASDLGLALLFWALCLKPSVAVIPFVLFIGARRWRPLLLGFFFLGVTWLLVAPSYGGWWSGLRDYSYLLNHYNNADFTPFMRREYIPGHDAEIRGLFLFDRVATGMVTLALLFLNWTGRLSLSGLFQGMIGVFLLFSPYLLPSEDWILCLLVVESGFFRDSSPVRMCGKLLVLFAIMDLRGGMIIPWEINFQCKCLLFGWMMAEELCHVAPTRNSDVPSS